jgi:ATP-dependent Clp protease protease subunit
MTFWNFKEIKNKETQKEELELSIMGDIVSDDESWMYEWMGLEHTAPNRFRQELSKHKGKDITLWIDSPGGSVFAGAGIYNALKEHKGKVTAKITKAISAASVIAMAADEVQMSPVGLIMIHNPWISAQGDMHDMRKMADVLDTVKETIINAYMGKSTKSREEISKMMDAETWLSAASAIENGFADSVLYQDGDIKMSFDSFDRSEIMNSLNLSLSKFSDIQRALSNKQEKINIDLAKAKLELAIKL